MFRKYLFSTDHKVIGLQYLMGATILLGVVFLGIKAFEWNDKLAHGLLPSTNNFLGLYFTMTGVHAAHLAAGILVNAYLWGPGMRMWRAQPERYAGRVAVARLFYTIEAQADYDAWLTQESAALTTP